MASQRGSAVSANRAIFRTLFRCYLFYSTRMHNDPDPAETTEWRDAFLALLATQGPQRARFMLDALASLARSRQIDWSPELVTPYVNSIPVDRQPPFPGDLAIEEKLASLMRWNALAMVARANLAYGELGGHIASYASAADLFEVGFNHFFHARSEAHGEHGGHVKMASAPWHCMAHWARACATVA